MNKRLIFLLIIFAAFYIGWIQLGWLLGIIKNVEVETPVPPPSVEDIQDNRQVEPNQNFEPEQSPAVTETSVEREFVLLESREVTIELDNRGAVIKSAVLKNYFESNAKERPVSLVASSNHYPGELVLPTGGRTLDRLFAVEKPDSDTVIFTHQSELGTLKKTYRLEGDFSLGLKITWEEREEPFLMVVGVGLQPLVRGDKLRPGLLDFGAISPKILHYTWSQDGDHKSKTPEKKLNDAQFMPRLEESEIVDWAGVKDTYFANVFVPERPVDNLFVKKVERLIAGNDEISLIPAVAISGTQSLSGQFYLGPILDTKLADADPLLENLLTYGWAGLLSEWLFYALDFFHEHTGNWGWSIVILTILIRIVLIPLMIPSLKSSFKMRQIQPKIQKLKEKYKGDDLETKQKLSQETFKLYREEGVNPFSSCITALAQMPIFFAYFSLLRSSIYLRQADWMFWISDLSIKDPTYILPIIMGITMFFSTAAMPMPSADPTQAKLMKFMPVLFSLMFLAMPSGLILYMIASNIFTLGQTYFLKWRFYRE